MCDVELEEKNRQLEKKIAEVYTHLTTLHYTVSTLMSVSFSDAKVVYDTVLGLACNFVNGNKGALLLFRGDGGQMFAESVKNLPQNLIGELAVSPDNSLLRSAVKGKKITRLGDFNRDDKDNLLAAHLRPELLVVPLIFENEVDGVIVISEKAGGQNFSEEDVNFLTAFSTMASSTISNARLLEEIKEKERLEQEMKIARHIQTALLPQIPKILDLDIAAMMKPCDEVGGDFYDFICGKDGRNWFAIGDVSSHGVTPGLIMMMAQSVFSTLITQDNGALTPKEAIAGINDVLYANIRHRLNKDDYMTLVVLAYNGNDEFTFAGAHEDILIYRAKEGKCERVQTTGLWVGMVDELVSQTENFSFKLYGGDIILLYTDGLIQARNEDGKQFDTDRLEQILGKNANLSVEELKETIWQEVSRWMLHQEDDISLVVIKKG